MATSVSLFRPLPPMPRTREISAGLLVYRRSPALQVLLAHPGGPLWAGKGDGAWSIPKGLVEPGEDLLAAARRELAEETGLTVAGNFAPLPPVRQASGKTVHAFAIEADPDLRAFRSNEFELEWPPNSGRLQRFPEIDRIAWFGLRAAAKKLIPYQRPLLRELVRVIAGPARPARRSPALRRADSR